MVFGSFRLSSLWVFSLPCYTWNREITMNPFDLIKIDNFGEMTVEHPEI